MPAENKKYAKNHNSKKKSWILIVIAGLAVIIGILAAILVIRSFSDAKAPLGEKAAQSAGALEMDANAEAGGLVYRSQEEIQAELNEKVREGMINISMNTSPVFEDSKAKGNLMIVNSEVNNYPQMVYIVRKDTGEEIYRSKGIPVGSKIEYATLDAELAPGSYDCVAYFNNVDMNGTILGTAGAEIVVNILK